MKKMFGKKLAFLLAAAVLAAGAFTSCEIDVGSESSYGSKLPNKTVEAWYRSNSSTKDAVLVFYADKTFVHADRVFGEDDKYYFQQEGTYEGDPTKDTGDDNEVLLTVTKIYDGRDDWQNAQSVEEFLKEYNEGRDYPLEKEEFTDIKAEITYDGDVFDCTFWYLNIYDYRRVENY